MIGFKYVTWKEAEQKSARKKELRAKKHSVESFSGFSDISHVSNVFYGSDASLLLALQSWVCCPLVMIHLGLRWTFVGCMVSQVQCISRPFSLYCRWDWCSCGSCDRFFMCGRRDFGSPCPTRLCGWCFLSWPLFCLALGPLVHLRRPGREDGDWGYALYFF